MAGGSSSGSAAAAHRPTMKRGSAVVALRSVTGRPPQLWVTGELAHRDGYPRGHPALPRVCTRRVGGIVGAVRPGRQPSN